MRRAFRVTRLFLTVSAGGWSSERRIAVQIVGQETDADGVLERACMWRVSCAP